MYNANFENKPVPGSVIKNCVRVIGSTTEICDEKIYPDPQVVTAAGSIVLSNATTEVNQYYTNDLYEFTIRAYDSNAIIIEEFTTLEYDPSVSSPSLAGAPAFIAANVNVVDGYNFTTTSPSGETFEGTLKITQVYDAVNDAFDTTLQAFGDSYIYTIDDAAILEGTSLKVDTADIFPPPFGTFELTVYDSTGAPIIAFSEPHSNLPQNYPANSGSTYPLLPGVYNPSVNDGGTLYPVAPFCVEPWKICENTAQVNYNGLSASASFTYNLPVDVDQTNIQTQFETLVVPDQYILRDCTGAVIYDTGQISTNGTPDIQDLDVTAFDLSCGYVELETIPDPMAGPMTVTIFSLSVGCCQGGEACVLPRRDPYLGRTWSLNDCGFVFWFNFPYVVDTVPPNDGYYFRNNIATLDGPTCIEPFSDILQQTASISKRPGNGRYFSNSTCINIGLPVNRTVSRVGNIVCFDFNSPAAYTMFEGFIDTVSASILAAEAFQGGRIRYVRVQGQDVLCGDDGSYVSLQHITYHPTMITKDPAANGGNGQICFDFDLHPTFGNSNSDPCLDDEVTDPDLFAERFYNAWNIYPYAASTQYNGAAGPHGWGTFSNGFSEPYTADPDYYWFETDMGITISSCANSNPVQYYTLKISKTDPMNDWTAYSGDVATNLVTPNELTNATIWNKTLCKLTSCNLYPDLDGYHAINIRNEAGLIVQDVNFSTKSFDLTYYGGGSSELLIDLGDLANRVSALTGIAFEGIPVYNIVFTEVYQGVGGLRDITCKDI